MAMINCHECGKEISSEAEKCPHCGAPPKKGIGFTTSILLGFLGVMFVVWILRGLFDGPSSPSQSMTPAAASQPAFVADQQTQTKRWEIIQRFVDMGVFYKIEVPGELPHLYVDRNWYSLTIDDKKTSAGLVYAYYAGNNSRSNIVVIKDKYSGKEIGTFTERGLSLK